MSKRKQPGHHVRRNDIGGRTDMPRFRLTRTPFNIEEEGPRIGWMRAIEPEVNDDADHRRQ